jgi:hypothetical protein
MHDTMTNRARHSPYMIPHDISKDLKSFRLRFQDALALNQFRTVRTANVQRAVLASDPFSATGQKEFDVLGARSVYGKLQRGRAAVQQ